MKGMGYENKWRKRDFSEQIVKIWNKCCAAFFQLVFGEQIFRALLLLFVENNIILGTHKHMINMNNMINININLRKTT